MRAEKWWVALKPLVTEPDEVCAFCDRVSVVSYYPDGPRITPRDRSSRRSRRRVQTCGRSACRTSAKVSLRLTL